jgi:hypothetical protein
MSDEVKTTLVKITHHHAAHVAAHWPYAAYGSNLSLVQMSERCRRADIVTSGKLVGYKLAFARVATILPDEGSTVPVGIYNLTPQDVESLDRKEGLSRTYDRYLVTPLTEDQRAIRCFTYVKRDPTPEAPSDKYYAKLLAGYRDWKFDDRRLRHARKTAQEQEVSTKLSRKAAHAFVNDYWRLPKDPRQKTLPFDESQYTTVPSLVTGRPLKVPRYVTASLEAIEWGLRGQDMFWRIKGSKTWYRDISEEADMGSGLVRGEIATPGNAFKPVDRKGL